MPGGWRTQLKIIAITVALTSLVWICAGLWWYFDRFGAPFVAPKYTGPGAQASTPLVERRPTMGEREKLGRTPSAGSDGLIIPVKGVKPGDLVDTFSQARAGGSRLHDAIDIMAPLGTPVLAASAGTIEKLFYSDDGGNTIYVRSPDRTRIYYYAHLDRYARGIHEGLKLRRGQAIGTVGYTGNANPDAPHLHFEIMVTTPMRKWYERKTDINPYPLLTRDGSMPIANTEP